MPVFVGPEQFSYFAETIAYCLQTVGLWSPAIKCLYTSLQCYYLQLCLWRCDKFEKAALLYCQRTERQEGLSPGTALLLVMTVAELLSTLCLRVASCDIKGLKRVLIRTN